MSQTLLELMEVITLRLDNTNERIDNVLERMEIYNKYFLLYDDAIAANTARINELETKLVALSVLPTPHQTQI